MKGIKDQVAVYFPEGLTVNADGSRAIEASEMDLAPGEWPEAIILVTPKDFEKRFRRVQELPEGGGFGYVAKDGEVLIVLND